MLFKRLRKKISEYFRRRFYPYIFNLHDDYSEILDFKDEIEKKNVLIGTIRRREQLSINISHDFYHIPTNQILSEMGIEYVALYQSKSIFNAETDSNGISHFARVTEAKHVKRCEINEIPSHSNEDYIRFDVNKWQSLPNTITIKEKYPKVFSKTSLYLLTHASYTCELYFETAEEYVFYLGVCDIVKDIYDGFEFCGMEVIKRGRKLRITSSRLKKKIKLKDFMQSPCDMTGKIFDFFKKALDK